MLRTLKKRISQRFCNRPSCGWVALGSMGPRAGYVGGEPSRTASARFSSPTRVARRPSLRRRSQGCDTMAQMIDADIRKARTLPAAFYRDAVLFERMRERVFARSWQLVDGAERAAARGSVLPFTLLEGCVDEPLLLTRDADGTLRALSNVCTHRGNLVCTAAATLQGLRCGYHGRRFALDGRCLGMPEFDGVSGFPSPSDDLPRVQLGELQPLLFAALDPALGFDDLVTPVRARMGSQLVPDPDGSRVYEIAANWALYCDNYLEGFHVPFVHGQLAAEIEYGSYRTELLSWGTLQVAAASAGGDAFDGSRVAAWYFFLFPNTML